MNTSLDNMQDTDLDEAINFCTMRSKEAIQAHDWTNLDYWNNRLHNLMKEHQQRQAMYQQNSVKHA